MVTAVNIHLKIEFLNPHGPRKTFSWPSVADICFFPASNILCVLCVMTAPTTTTGRIYRISDTDFEQNLKAYENHKIQPCIYKAVVHIWSFLSLGTIGLIFFSKFLATHMKLLGVKMELEIALPLRLSKGPSFLNFGCYF